MAWFGIKLYFEASKYVSKLLVRNLRYLAHRIGISEILPREKMLFYPSYPTQVFTWKLHIGCLGTHAHGRQLDVILIFKWRHHNMSLVSVFGNFWGPMLYLMVSNKKNPLLVWRWDRKIRPSASLVMPNGDPREGFFYPSLTLMIDPVTLCL